MKTTDIPSIIFTENDERLYAEIRQIAKNLRLKDPSKPHNPNVPSNQVMQEMEEAYKPEYLDENSREFRISIFWFIYLGFVYVQGKPENKKKKGKYIDTSNNRKKEIKRAISQFGYVPSGESLKQFYNLPEKFDEFCKLIDDDIQRLS